MKKWVYANDKELDQTAQPESLLRNFALHQYILQYPMILLADSKGPDQPAQMRRLIRALLFAYATKAHLTIAGIVLIYAFQTLKIDYNHLGSCRRYHR